MSCYQQQLIAVLIDTHGEPDAADWWAVGLDPQTAKKAASKLRDKLKSKLSDVFGASLNQLLA